jgi:hypothetical protein
MKRTFTLLFTCCFGILASQNLSNGLKACYAFNNNAQNSASTGAALNGTIVGASATTGHTGSVNTAYSVNGSVNSYIVLPDDPWLKNDSVFFSGWFRIDSIPPPATFPSISYLVYTSNGCISNFEAYSLDIQYAASGGTLSFCVTKCGSDCGTKPQITSTVVPVVGNWYHVCFYISNSVMKLYVNGALQSSINHGVQFGYQSGKKVYLGVTNESNYNRYFKGAIDNVRFYNRELTQQEITLLYMQDPTCVPSTVAIDETGLSSVDFKIYPNPAADRIFVENLAENTLFIYDVLGMSVKYSKTRVSENVNEISLLDAAPGVYFVKTVSPQGTKSNESKLVLTK